MTPKFAPTQFFGYNIFYSFGGDWPRLEFSVYKWHAGEAWLAPSTIQAHINANENDALIAQAEAIANGAAQAVVA